MIDRTSLDEEGINGVAAEYVLGTLDAAERAEVAALRATDAALDAAITDYENKLAPLNELIPQALPSPGLYTRIEQRLGFDGDAFRPVVRSVSATRRFLPLVASLLVAIAVTLTLHYGSFVPAKPQLVALLQKDAAAPLFTVSFNEKTSALVIHNAAPALPADKDYELWLIADGDPVPHALGVLPKHDGRLTPQTTLTPTILSHATLAVSLEPAGGSPTGAPTGPVIVTGKVVRKLL